MIELVPAIDIIEGKCVRLTQGDYNQKTVYNEDPLEVAKMFVDNGLKRLHLVDLDGAKAQHIVNYKVLERIANRTNLIIDFGGGLKTDEDLEIAFNSGAKMVTGGSIAVKNSDVFGSWLEKYGRDRIILGADVKDNKIAVSGWKEETDLQLNDFLKSYVNKGIYKVISTDISKDGMLQGPATELYKQMMADFPELFVIASGGVSGIEDIEKLNEVGVHSVIFGKAIYEGRINLRDLRQFV
jgi:phosphoribosylformimino-5-aminoimidazole carboxamide ribotide isomerase